MRLAQLTVQKLVREGKITKEQQSILESNPDAFADYKELMVSYEKLERLNKNPEKNRGFIHEEKENIEMYIQNLKKATGIDFSTIDKSELVARSSSLSGATGMSELSELSSDVKDVVGTSPLLAKPSTTALPRALASTVPSSFVGAASASPLSAEPSTAAVFGQPIKYNITEYLPNVNYSRGDYVARRELIREGQYRTRFFRYVSEKPNIMVFPNPMSISSSSEKSPWQEVKPPPPNLEDQFKEHLTLRRNVENILSLSKQMGPPANLFRPRYQQLSLENDMQIILSLNKMLLFLYENY
jgi:hypothetical protein